MEIIADDDPFWIDDLIAPELLLRHPRNPKLHPVEQVEHIRGAIRELGFTRSVMVLHDGLTIVAGHGAVQAAVLERLPAIPIRRRNPAHPLTDAQELAMLVGDNKLADAPWDEAELNAILTELRAEDFPLDVTGFSLAEADALVAQIMQGSPPPGQGAAPGGGYIPPAGAGSLADRFLVVPFSVLNAREGWWQARKATWLALGIRSEVGRGANLLNFSDTLIEPDPEKRAAMQATRFVQGAPGNVMNAASSADPDFYRKKGEAERELGRSLTVEEFAANHHEAPAESYGTGTSIFDPVLCELAYRWFCPPGGAVLDPFAGGSVRGILAAKLGRSYAGVELRAEQIAANEEQAREILGPDAKAVVYHEGDAADIERAWFGLSFDMVFTCPPYFDLEQYSDDQRDLSNMEWDQFIRAYQLAIRRAVALLLPNRFACVVVGEVRDKKGIYRGLVPATIEAFELGGMAFYNEAILVTAVGSLPIRAGRTFAATRKLGKTHQNVLVFVKGDPAKAAEACGIVDVADFEQAPPGGEPLNSADALADAQELELAPIGGEVS